MTTYTLSEDRRNHTAAAIDFTANNDTWIIPVPRLAVSFIEDGIVSVFAGSRVVNRGELIGRDCGVDFSGNNFAVVNHATGRITGESFGIYLGGDGGSVVNRGVIGADGNGIFAAASSSGVSISNFGTISGAGAGVVISSDADGGFFRNFGKLQSAGTALSLNTDTGMRTTVINEKGGVIGGATSISQAAGAFTLTNRGTTGAINGNIESDIVNNFGRVGMVQLGGGDDRFNGAGGRSGEILGGQGFDRLFAGRGPDTVRGDADADQLGGGSGNDILEGGLGGDTFRTDPGQDDIFLYSQSLPTLDDFAADTVRYTSLRYSGLAPATRDVIWGFDGGTLDRIDLSPIDANGNAPGNGKFKVVTNFTAARGEIRFVVQGGNTLVQLDGDNDTAIDATILVMNVTGLQGTDFVL